MKDITLNVSGLTRAVMLHRYKEEPIRLDGNDIRRREIMNVGSPDRHLDRKKYVLNTTITLTVNKHVHDHMNGRRSEIGYYLHDHDKHNMFQFVWGRVTAELPALHALRDYYLLKGITDDDHDIETAERQWKRWRERNEKDRTTNTPEFVPRPLCVLLSERQANSMIERMLALIDDGCIQMDPRYRGAIAAWVYADLTPMTFRQVAKKVGRDLGNTNHSVTRLRAYMEYNNDLRTLAAYCLKTTKARPTPSAAS